MSFAINSGAFRFVFCGQPFLPLSKTDEKIRSFASLPAGWHYGKGVSARPDIVRIARQYLWHFLMLGYLETDAFPGVGGEIAVTAYRGEHFVEVVIELDRTFVVTHEFNGEDRYRESDLSGVKACEAIGAITANIEQEECATLSWLTSTDTTTIGTTDLTTWLSNPLGMGAAHPSFWCNAGLMPAEQYAPISINSITALEETLQFSGNLTIQTSIQHAGSNKQMAGTTTTATTR